MNTQLSLKHHFFIAKYKTAFLILSVIVMFVKLVRAKLCYVIF